MNIIQLNKFDKSDMKKISIYELFMLFVLYYVIVWILIPSFFVSTNAILFTILLESIACIYFIFISPNNIHKNTLKERGIGPKKYLFIRLDNFKKFYENILIPYIFTVCIIVIYSWYQQKPFFSNPNPYPILIKLVFYFFSASIQDIFFFSFILLRIKELIDFESHHLHKYISVGIFSAIFMLFHMPNIPLMILSFCFAYIFGLRFYNTPNLFAVIIAHATLGTLLHSVYNLHMRIGPLYGIEHNSSLTRFLFPIINEYLNYIGWKN